MQNIEIIKNTLSELLTHLGVSFSQIEVIENDILIRVNIDTEEAPLIIGWHGKNLEALQQLFKSILWKKGVGDDLFVTLDVNEYKRSSEEKIINIAKEKAQMVASTGISQLMPVLGAAERRLIHLELAKGEIKGIMTESIEDDNGVRRLKIYWKGE